MPCAPRVARAAPTARSTTYTRRSCWPSASAALATRVGFDPVEVDDVVAGNGILTGDHDAVGRLAVLMAGWPETVPGMTLNRFCGSAQQAITVAAMGVASGHQDLVVAGGVESMSRWDLDRRVGDHRRRQPGRSASSIPTVPQGISADLIATLEGFDRTDVDTFAVAEPAARRTRHDRGPVRPQHHPGYRPTGRRAARGRRAPPPGYDRSRDWPSCGRRSPRWATTYDDGRPVALPERRAHRARAPRRELVGSGRRRRRRGGRVRRVGAAPTASPRAPVSGRPPRSARSP